MTTSISLNRLRLSLLWFALLAAVFSTLFVWLLITVAPNLRDLALAAISAAIISSILCWWLLIVHPQKVTVVRGGLAGILSVVLALFLMWVIWGIAAGEPFQGGNSLMASLVLGLITMVVVSISPLGWFLLALGGSSGGLLAFLTRRWAVRNTPNETSLPGE